MFTMLVSLYTSREILRILGVDDYGIYQTVGGIVGFLSFLNSALSAGSSRFLTFELGTGDKEKLSRTFSTTLTIHIILAVFIAIIAETAGLWFLHNKLVIAPDRLDAAIIVFHLSIITALLVITQVPYSAVIISHEKMSIFAYVSIVEVSAKLAVVYLLNIGDIDKLKLYAGLLCVLQISLMVFYRIYCSRNFKEAKYRFIFDRSIFKPIASYSGWSLFANASWALNNQGILILLNMFFTPAVVTARALSIQVSSAARQFVQNFRMAANPQIIKQYAAKNHEGSKRLLLSTTKYSYYLMFLISLPIYLLAEPLLNLWLTEVPVYTMIFLQLIIIENLFDVFNVSFLTALSAKGQIKENALISPAISFTVFPIVYLFFKSGYSPVTLSWVYLIMVAILGLIVKPILLIRIVDYSLKDIMKVFIPCFKVTLFAIPLPVISYSYFNSNTISGFLIIGIISILSSASSIFFVGMDKKMRLKIVTEVKRRLSVKGITNK
jgi:O-antigen/teichoic acid export membrane protein